MQCNYLRHRPLFPVSYSSTQNGTRTLGKRQRRGTMGGRTASLVREPPPSGSHRASASWHSLWASGGKPWFPEGFSLGNLKLKEPRASSWAWRIRVRSLDWNPWDQVLVSSQSKLNRRGFTSLCFTPTCVKWGCMDTYTSIKNGIKILYKVPKIMPEPPTYPHIYLIITEYWQSSKLGYSPNGSKIIMMNYYCLLGT